MPELSLFRPIATTRLYKKGKRNPVLKTVIPRPVLELIGTAAGRYLFWAGGGLGYRRPGEKAEYLAVPCKKDVPGAVRIQPTGTAIPMEASEAIGLEDGGIADWLLMAEPDGTWKVYISARDVEYGDEWPVRGEPDGLSSRLLTTTNIRKYQVNGGTPIYNARFPAICHRILGLDDEASVKWENIGEYYRIVPCHPAMDGARKISRQGSGPRDPTSAGSYTIRLPHLATRLLYAGEGSGIKWHVAADGHGRWEIRAWPVKTWTKRKARGA